MAQTDNQSVAENNPDYEPVGQGDYVVQPDDCMHSIAYDHGFFWETLWNLPENRELKDARQDPYVLYPGDRVFIPDLRKKEEAGETEQRHRFKLKEVPAKLRLQVLSEDEPVANEPYTIDIDGHIEHGETDDDGFIEVSIKPNAKRAKLKVGSGAKLKVYELQLGGLTPNDGIRGVQSRLNNLGFHAGEVDGTMGPNTRDALRRFQLHYELEETGEPDEPTRAKLIEVHGS
jgi:N-acetylmuramoyl-L-alanine amidase